MRIIFLLLLIYTCIYHIHSQQIIGAQTSFNIGIDNLDTCNILSFGMFEAMFDNLCIPIHIDNQPNCSIYFECARKLTTYQAYQDCLEPGTNVVYASPTFNNLTAYAVPIYLVSNCSGAPIFTQYIDFGCYTDFFFNANNTVCNITQVIRPMFAATSGVGRIVSVLDGWLL